MIISSVDIGTNTVLLLIADADLKNKKIIPLLNKYRIPRIGKNVDSTGIISADSVEKLKDTLLEYKAISETYSSTKIIATATAALRRAWNKEHILNYIHKQTGISIRVIDGEEEAYLAYLGVTEGSDDVKLKMVIDIGGGSTELVAGIADNLSFKKSFNIGVVSASESNKSGSDHYYTDFFNGLSSLNITPDETYAIAGTPTTLAAIKAGSKQYDENTIEGMILSLNDINSIIGSYIKSPKEFQEEYYEILKGREDLIIPGSYILKTIISYLNIENIIVSTRGIRHGVVIEYLKSQG